MKQKKAVSKSVTFEYPCYMLPPFLQGVVSLKDYRDWLDHKANHLWVRDNKLKRPYAEENTKMVYKQSIHQAVLDGGEFDPYTGEKLNWGLISKKRTLKKEEFVNDYLHTYAMHPAVDHINPEEFGFEICSWISNESKSSMTPDEFVEFCQKVAAFRGQAKNSRW
jgi:hypothetical protein